MSTEATNHRKRWLAAWLGGVPIGIGNGALREAVLARRFGEKQASQLSGLTLGAAFAVYFSILQRRWPLRSNSEALEVGGAWAALSIAFEFSFGRIVVKQSWDELLDAYRVHQGRLWPLLLLWIGVGPAVARALLPRSAQSTRLLGRLRVGGGKP